MKAVERQILDTGQVGGSNEFPKVDGHEYAPAGANGDCSTCGESGMTDEHDAFDAAPIAPAAVAESTDELMPCPFCGGVDLKVIKMMSEDEPHSMYAMAVMCQTCHAHGRHNYPIGWTESEQAAQEGWNDRPQQHIANLESELQIARDLIQQMRQQLSAANLGSAMQHERYGSY